MRAVTLIFCLINAETYCVAQCVSLVKICWLATKTGTQVYLLISTTLSLVNVKASDRHASQTSSNFTVNVMKPSPREKMIFEATAN